MDLRNRVLFVSSLLRIPHEIRPRDNRCRPFLGARDILIYDSDVRQNKGARTAIGFVLIDIEPTREKEVYQKLMKVEHIVELYPLFGEYDLIAKVEADSYDAIGDIVVSKIRAIPGVKATKTLARVSF